MAKFVKEGTKGAVGTLTKAETVVAGEVDLSILKADVSEDISTLIEDIKGSHKVAIGQFGRAVIAAARAGQLLLAAKVKLPKDKPFTEWVTETFEFSWRTAYDYIRVKEAVDRHAPEIENCKSIRDVLKLSDSADSDKKKKRDVRRESYVTYAAKIERYFADEKKESPIEDWDTGRRETHAKMLEGIVRIYNELVS